MLFRTDPEQDLPLISNIIRSPVPRHKPFRPIRTICAFLCFPITILNGKITSAVPYTWHKTIFTLFHAVLTSSLEVYSIVDSSLFVIERHGNTALELFQYSSVLGEPWYNSAIPSSVTFPYSVLNIQGKMPFHSSTVYLTILFFPFLMIFILKLTYTQKMFLFFFL